MGPTDQLSRRGSDVLRLAFELERGRCWLENSGGLFVVWFLPLVLNGPGSLEVLVNVDLVHALLRVIFLLFLLFDPGHGTVCIDAYLGHRGDGVVYRGRGLELAQESVDCTRFGLG